MNSTLQLMQLLTRRRIAWTACLIRMNDVTSSKSLQRRALTSDLTSLWMHRLNYAFSQTIISTTDYQPNQTKSSQYASSTACLRPSTTNLHTYDDSHNLKWTHQVIYDEEI